MSKKALGKGLSALIQDDPVVPESKSNSPQRELPIDSLQAGKSQPREIFADQKLHELAESIKENGILQPILVRELYYNGTFEIIAGERRFRAAKLAGLSTVPVIIKNLDDVKSLEIALIENIQREDLTPIEEAEGYKRLQNEVGYTQEQLSKEMGKSRSYIANMLRLLNLPQSVKSMLNSGIITIGHARVLLSAENPDEIAQKIVDEQLTVRDVEKLITKKDSPSKNEPKNNVKSPVKKPVAQASQQQNKDEDLLLLEQSLSDKIGLKVTITDSPAGGQVILHFNNLTELDTILQKMG